MAAGPVIFLGPTLGAPEAAAELPQAVILGPARQGDVFHAVRGRGATAIGIVDGAFLDVPSVWHREILWALDRGVPVLGAASMGALRAAELDRFGMRGVGLVYDAYATGTLPGWPGLFEDDDEVAVIHAPAELRHAPLSDAMVDLRITLARAADAGLLSAPERDRLSTQLKALHFPERSLARLKHAAIQAGHADLACWLVTAHVSQKRLDALQMLQAIREQQAPAPPDFEMQQALTWLNYVAGARRLDDTEQAAIDRLRQDPVQWQRRLREALGRMDSLRNHPNAPGASQALADLCRDRGFQTRADLAAWAAAAGLDQAALLRLAQEEATLRTAVRANAGPALEGAAADLARLSR